MARPRLPLAPSVVSAALHERHQPLAPRQALPAACRSQLTAALLRHGLDPAAALDLIVDLRRLTHARSLAGLMRLLAAFEALMVRSIAQHLGAAWEGPRPTHTLFLRLRDALKAVDQILPQLALRRPPRLEDDRLGCFLWEAARKPLPPAASHLLEICRRALFRAELDPARQSHAARSVLDRLPYQLATFVRYFPPERLPANGAFLRDLRRSDIERAFDTYQASPTGLQTRPTRDEYIRTVAAVLGIAAPQPRPVGTLSSAAWPELRRFAEESGREVILDLESDEEGRLRGCLIYPDARPDDEEHVYERASWVAPEWQARLVRPLARTEWYPNVTDGRTLTPNELVRTIGALSTLVSTGSAHQRTEWARFAFLLGTILWTGLLPKRLLRARLWTGPPEALASSYAERTLTPEDEMIILPGHGILLCRIDEELIRGGEEGAPSPGHLIAIPLPDLLWNWADVAWGPTAPSSSPHGPLAFPHPRFRRPIDLSEVRSRLQQLSMGVRLLAPLSWARLRRLFRTYTWDHGTGSPLLPALASGSPTRQERVELHYVSFDAELFLTRCRSAQDAIWTFVAERLPTTWPHPVPPIRTRASALPAWVATSRLGARFVVSDQALRTAWHGLRRAIGQASRPTARLNRLTLAAATVLIAGAGVRERELAGIMSAHLDLQAGLLRLEGKANRYFRESREVPLNLHVVATLRRYREALDSGVPGVDLSGGPLFWVYHAAGWRPLASGDLDRLIEQEQLFSVWRFSPRLLRHWLRTKLELLQVPCTAIREAFGHVTETDSVWHELSTVSLDELHTCYRAATAVALESILDAEVWCEGGCLP